MRSNYSPVQRRSLLGSLGVVFSAGLAGCTSELSPNSDSKNEEESLTLPSVVTTGELPEGQVKLLPENTVTLLNFFATWCKPCIDEMPDFRKLREEYDEETLHMVSITPEVDEELIEEFWAEHDGSWPVVNDPGLEATEKWDANTYPTNLLFNQNAEQVTGDGHGLRVRDFEGLQSKIDPLIEDTT